MPQPRGPRRALGLLGGAAPLGRLGHRLGFRWVFPIGTLAVPFHPLLARALPWVPVALVTYAVARVVGGLEGGVSPLALLGAAVVVGLLLSVPILNYALFAFRFPLLQGLLVTGAMVLVAVDVVAGETSWGWAALPGAYAALFLALRVGGPVALRNAERRNAGVIAVDPGHRGVEVTGWKAADTAQWLVEHCDLPRVSANGLSRLRVDAATYERVGEVSELISTGYTRANGDVLAVRDLQPAAVRVHATRGRGWWRLLGEDVVTWEVIDGGHRQRLVSSKASLVSLPVFICFRFIAIFGGTSRWVIGFPRRTVAASADVHESLAHAFPPLVGGPRHLVDPVEVLVPLEAALVESRRRYWALLDQLSAEQDLSFRSAGQAPDLTPLAQATGGLMTGSGERLCDLVDRAKHERGHHLAAVCALALSRLPLEEFRSLTPRILTIVSSRILSLQWTITPDLDVRPLPRNLPRFGDQAGFGLLARARVLYERLGELDDPRALRVIEALAAEVGWEHPLTRARDTYLSRHPR